MNGLLFVLFLIIIAVLRQILGIINSRVYTTEYRDILQDNQNGFFGVGQYQPKFKINEVCLVVIDSNNTIKDCRIIRGISIFARFHYYEDVINQNVSSAKVLSSRHHRVIQEAAANAQRQIINS